MTAPPPADVDASARAQLGRIADALIPEAHGMPAATSVGVADDQLDAVLHAAPDLVAPLRRALDRAAGETGDVETWLAGLAATDRDAHDALVLVILAGYYWSEPVKAALGYPGQTAVVVSTAFPAYIEEGLLDPVLERGEIYRQPPEHPDVTPVGG